MSVVSLASRRPPVEAVAPKVPKMEGGFAMVIKGYSVLMNNERTFMQLLQHMQIAKQGVSPERPTP